MASPSRPSAPTPAKVVLAGTYQDGFNSHVALLRLNTDGTQDGGFGTGGQVKTVVGSSDFAEDVAVQTDDKFVVAGWTDSDVLVLRYLPDGAPDTTFGGGDGVVTFSLTPGEFDRAYSVALQSDGNMLVSGVSVASAGGQRDFAVHCFNANGTVDTSFGGGDGSATVTTGPGVERAWGVAVQADGRVVAAGVCRATARRRATASATPTATRCSSASPPPRTGHHRRRRRWHRPREPGELAARP